VIGILSVYRRGEEKKKKKKKKISE